MFPTVFRTAQSQRNRILLHHSLRLNLRLSPARIAIQRCLATAPSSRKPAEDINVKHSTFLAQASSQDTWEKHSNGSVNGGYDAHKTELDSIADDKGVKQFARAAFLMDCTCTSISCVYCFTGKLSSTSSHLLKLILPLDKLQFKESHDCPPTVFLLHPSQPLSHISRLIAASLTPENLSISFRSTSPSGRRLQWSDSTDVGDFIRDAARASKFEIFLTGKDGERHLQVEVPSFDDRTRFLRRRLKRIDAELQDMEGLKRRCDKEAHQGARKMAVGGLGMMVVYWAAVARLTFWDFGWYARHRL